MKDGFFTEDEIVEQELANLDPKSRAYLMGLPKDDVIMLHHGTGTRIRNFYRLWDENNPFTDNADPMGDKFADQVSQRIIVRIWESVNNG